MNSARGAKILGLVVLGLATAGCLGLALGFVVMWLWNALMPGIFGLPEIGYWQAVGLFILAHLLFKSGNPHGHQEHDRFFTPHSHSHPHAKKDVRAKVRAWLNDEKTSSDDKAETKNEPGL